MQPKEHTHTTKDLSSEEVELSSISLDERLKNRKVDRELLQRAWNTAHKIAAMLYKDFGASHVAVFGSLAEGYYFSKWSDIDIVVWGIPNDKSLRALSVASDISRLFKVDLVMFENCEEAFQERISKQLRYIEKGVVFNVDRSNLIERIGTERDKIEKTIAKIDDRLQKIKAAPEEYREEIETTIAKNLVDCYQGMENIFRRIALDVDIHLPDGSMWHKELLSQMVERPSVITQETYLRIQELLEFRHVFNNIYGEELVYERIEKIGKEIGGLFQNLSKELDLFITWLEK